MKLLRGGSSHARFLVGGLLAAGLLGAGQLRADAVLDWNEAVINAVRNESTPPPLVSRNLAIMHVAMFDAVNSITGNYQPYHFSVPNMGGASIEAAASSAAYYVATTLYPSERSAFETLYATELSQLGSGASVQQGLALGQSIAQGMLALRAADGASTSVPYIPSMDPGEWRRTPPYYRPPELPQWRYVTPFAIDSPESFRPPGPPSLTSAEYAFDYNLTKDLGAANSTVRTQDQTEIAIFWSDFSYTSTPPGHWNEIAQEVAGSQGNSLESNARLFAMINVALADAAIVAWDAKYGYNLWRPVTAIQNGDLDGNPNTVADPQWTSLLIAPAFPEYVSGHSTFSGAAAAVLADFFGTDHIEFTIGSDALPGVFRTYSSFMEAADEIGMSRIYGGIHFLSADLDGLEAGAKVGEFVSANYFAVIPEPSPLFLLAAGGCVTWIAAVGRRRCKTPG